MNEKKNYEQQQTELLEELVKWTKVVNYDKLISIFRTILKTKRQRYIYQDTGIQSFDQLREVYNISPKKLGQLLDGWVRIGLLDKKGGKYKRLFDLKDFGLLPKKKKPVSKINFTFLSILSLVLGLSGVAAWFTLTPFSLLSFVARVVAGLGIILGILDLWRQGLIGKKMIVLIFLGIIIFIIWNLLYFLVFVDFSVLS